MIKFNFYEALSRLLTHTHTLVRRRGAEADAASQPLEFDGVYFIAAYATSRAARTARLPTSHPQTAAISTLITIAESAFSEAHAPIHGPTPLSHTTATMPGAQLCWVLKAITTVCLESETKVVLGLSLSLPRTRNTFFGAAQINRIKN